MSKKALKISPTVYPSHSKNETFLVWKWDCYRTFWLAFFVLQRSFNGPPWIILQKNSIHKKSPQLILPKRKILQDFYLISKSRKWKRCEFSAFFIEEMTNFRKINSWLLIVKYSTILISTISWEMISQIFSNEAVKVKPNILAHRLVFELSVSTNNTI